MADKVYQVLFLCTGNSARWIIAETILNRLGLGHSRRYSAGSHPRGKVHPRAVELLEGKLSVARLRCKSWEEFAGLLRRSCISCSPSATGGGRGLSDLARSAHDRPLGHRRSGGVVGQDERKLRRVRDAYSSSSAHPDLHQPADASLDRLTLQKRLDEIGRSRAEAPA